MQLYTHPESGAQLAKPLAQPHVTRFSDVFTDHAPYVHDQPSPFASQWLEEGKERMEVSAYCIHRDKPSMRVRPADWVLSRIREGTIVVDRDTMHFEIIDHDNGWSLVTASHGLIIGSLWLAYIRTESIPV